MNDKKFLQYLGDYRVHDGVIEEVSVMNGFATVVIISADQEKIKFEFSGVKEVRDTNAKGMMLYSLSEMSGEEPYRYFVFTNWDDYGTASLEIIAKDYKLVDIVSLNASDTEKACNICCHPCVRNDIYDAWFCPICNIWLEQKCGDSDCEYCKERPERPL